MELSSILIGVGMLLLFMVPIIYLVVVQNKKRQAKTKKLYEISRNNNLNLDVVETTDMVVLGLDTASRKLIVVEPLNNNNFVVVNLEDLKSSKIKTTSASKKENQYLHVAMELFEKATGKKIFEIVYYEDEVDLNLNPEAELLRAKKWHELLENSL